VLCVTVVSAGSGISIGEANHMDERIKVSLSNNNNFDLDNARVRAYIPELGIFTQLSSIDLDDDDRTSAMLHMLDEVPEGEYLVRISVRHGSRRKISHRYVYFE